MPAKHENYREATIAPGVGPHLPKKQLSVIWRCTLTLIVTVTLALAAFCYTDYLRDKQLRVENLHRVLQSLAWQLSQMLVIPLRENDESQVSRLVETMMNGDLRIQAIQVKGDGAKNASFLLARDAGWRPFPTTKAPDNDNLATVTTDIVYKDTIIGHVSVWITDRFERQTLNTLIIYRIVGIVIVNIVLTIIIGYIFRRILIVPLRSVEEYAFRISNGEENATLPKGYFPKELENLRASIERMVAELAAQYQELFTSNAALAAAKEQYQSVFQNATEGIYQETVEGKFIVVNPALAHMFGYDSPETFMQQVDEALVLYANPEDRDTFVSTLAATGRVQDFEAQYRHKDGRMIWLSETAQLCRKGPDAPYFIYGMTQDITNRRMAEDALRESEEKYRALMESANDAVFVHDIGGDGLPGLFIEVNKEACRRLGYSREQLLSMSPLDLDDPHHLSCTLKAGTQLTKDGFTIFETAHRTSDGGSIPVEVSSRRVELRGKTLVFSIARDITERK